jgi:hypothetical protein
MGHGAAKPTQYDLIHTTEEHLHNEGKVYPTLATGVIVTSSATAWTLGNYAEVIPGGTVTEDFDIHWIVVEGASADATYEIVLYKSTTEIARTRITIPDFANIVMLQSVPILSPVVDGNYQIQAKVATENAAADTITISVGYHTY